MGELTMQGKVSKVRALISDARTLRGLPAANSINGLDAALNRAKELRVRHAIDPPTAPYPIRRKTLLARIRYNARCYGLYAQVDDFVDASGASNLNGLDLEALDALCAWVEQSIDTMQQGLDWAEAPPAR